MEAYKQIYNRMAPVRPIPKPGPPKKPAKILNRSARQHDIKPPEKKHCRWCKRVTGSECFRHCEIPELKFKYGKGLAIKVDDNLTVWGCDDCDREMSRKPWRATELEMLQWENKWLMGILETHLV